MLHRHEPNYFYGIKDTEMSKDPVAYAYEYEEFNGQWMRTVIFATEGGSGRLCAPPKTHDSKPVRNVRALYAH
jgi:hypothetical protein